MTTVLAIDPGSTESAYALVDANTCRPLEFGKIANSHLLDLLSSSDFAPNADRYAIEMIASYGMAVGAEVFETCVWIGRYQQAIQQADPWAPCDLVKRQPVKVHHCHSAKAKDANITQALVDRFAPGEPNHGKGTKTAPGWFHGFRADVWQAYALGVYVADLTHARSVEDVVVGGRPV
jgi:hypothetical protein